MEIRNAIVHQLEIPLKREYELSDTTSSMTETTLVILETADGERGIGTADPVVGHFIPQTPEEIYTSLSDQILPAIINTPPENPNKLRKLLDDYPGKENAQFAAETAYLDLYCRQRNESLADFLGGRLRDHISLNGWVGVSTPEIMANEAKQLEEEGFKSFKMKASGDTELDRRRVQSVCESVDNMEVRIDANEGYPTADTAIKAAQAFEEYPVEYLEQPVSRDDFSGMKKITQNTNIDIMADEPIFKSEDGYRYLSAGAADRLKFKCLQTGGVMNLQKGLNMAEAAGVSCVIGHGFCTSPAASAELQLAASNNNIFGSVETVGSLKNETVPFEEINITNGVAEIPSGVGLGVKLLDDSLDDFSVASNEITT